MKISYRQAVKGDAALLVELYNKSFYDDFIRYGECPGYGRSKEKMEISIEEFPKDIILCDDVPVGVISSEKKGEGEYYLGCLCIIPEYQGKGIGTIAVNNLKDSLSDLKKLTLITPSDNEENVRFYTKKCGFKIKGREMAGNIEVTRFLLEK